MISATERARRSGLGIPTGMLVIRGIDVKGARKSIQAQERWMLETIRGQQPAVQENLDAYANLFDAWGHSCPLPAQVRSIREKGLPSAPPLVRALLLCEAAHGLLMGAQDWDRVQGPLTWDLADPGETLEGFKGCLPCTAGEPVLRHGQGLLASYFQGPDRRTALHAGTRSVLFLAFGTPGMPREKLKGALAAAGETLGGAFEKQMGPWFLDGIQDLAE